MPENFKESSDPITDFTSSLIEISKECIPQTSTNPAKSNPWYNDDCITGIFYINFGLMILILL